jgi:hypothetical protein
VVTWSGIARAGRNGRNQIHSGFKLKTSGELRQSGLAAEWAATNAIVRLAIYGFVGVFPAVAVRFGLAGHIFAEYPVTSS